MTDSEKKRVRLKLNLDSARNRICEVCYKHIENARLRQMVHDGECADIKRKRRLAANRKAKRLEKPPEIASCVICKKEFIKKRHNAKVCGNRVCKNKLQRDNAKIAYAAMSYEDKKALRKKKYKADFHNRERYKKCSQSLIAKCPRCETDHKVRFETGYIGTCKPRIYCPKCKRITEEVGDVAPRYRATFGTMTEYHRI